MPTSYIESRGCIVWHDLVAGRADEAVGFYRRTIGWEVDCDLENGHAFVRWRSGQAPVGGVLEPCGVLSSVAPAWLPYVAIPDADATCRHVESLGGAVVVSPEQRASGAVCAILSDPQGAKFGIVAAGTAVEPESPAGVGRFSWHELTTPDCRAALEFYGALLGWEGAGQYDRRETGMYYLFGRRGRVMGGIQHAPRDRARAEWLSYVRVEDIRISADRTAAFGGSVSVPPTEVPGGDWIMVAVDPLGSPFAAHEMTGV